MSRIVTQSKLNELTGKNIDYGKGGGYCPHYQTIISLWGSVVASSNYQPNQLVKEEDIVVNKDLFLINAETGSLYFAGGGTYAQIPAIDGHEDFVAIAGGGEAIGASYQGGARIYTFLATSAPNSLTYYTPGMFTPNAVIQGAYASPRGIVYSTTSNYTYFSANPTGTQWTAATTRPQLTGLTKGLYVNEAGTDTFMLIGNNMKSVSTDMGNNWTTSTLGEYTLTDLIYVDSNWYAIGSNGTKRLLLQNTASTFDQSNKILDLPDYSRQVIKINT